MGQPVMITTTRANRLNSGDQVLIQGLTGGYMEFNGNNYYVTPVAGSTTQFTLNPDYSLPRSANRDVWVSSIREELWAVAPVPGQKAPLPPSEDAELRRPLDG
jgi:hypothetical protein